MGRFWGFSDEHSSLVVNVCNLITGYISPQFHLVFDDLFETFIRTRDCKSVFNAICNDMFELNRVCYAKDDHDDNVNIIYKRVPLEDVWLDEQGHRDRRHKLEDFHRRREDFICKKNHAVPDIIPLNTKDYDARPPTVSPVSEKKLSVDY